MKQQCLLLTVIFVISICSIDAGETIKYASGCGVDLCTLKNTTNNTGSRNNGSGCPNVPLCYHFETANQTSFCAPQVVCSLFDPCTSARRCATNTSVCVINTCCPAPICMPLSLASGCTMYKRPSDRDSWSGTVCPNATWSSNGTIFIDSNLNYSYSTNFGDFSFDKNDNIYIVDSNSYRILKFSLNNTSVFSVVGVTSGSSTYQSQHIYVDSNGTVYSAESWYSMSNTYYYRIVKYTQQNGVIIYGPTTCGTTLGELCGCTGLFVDNSGFIYYSDSTNHRVLKITPFASSATVVAGTSGMSGSLSNQLSSPQGIAVDSTGALYVADSNNYRLVKFPAGNNLGTVLYSGQSYNSPYSVTIDNSGSIYFGMSNGIYKYLPNSNAVVQVISQTLYSYYNLRLRMDSYGNLYTNGYMTNNVFKYNLTSNYC